MLHIVVGVLLSGTVLFSGTKKVDEVTSPIVPIPKVSKVGGLYLSGALYYNNIYSDDYAWFDNGTDTQDELAGLTLIVGYEYNQFLAFEARASKSFLKEDYADEYHMSFFLKPQYRFRDKKEYEENYFTLYGLLGVGYIHIDGTDGETPAAAEVIGKNIISTWDFQYGIGISYTIVNDEYLSSDKGDISIFIEYNMHMDEKSILSRLYEYNPNTYTDLSMNGLNVGLSYHF